MRVVVLALAASVDAFFGCQDGTLCAGVPGTCADCSMTQAECTTAGKQWVDAVKADGTGTCAAGTPVIWGCRSYAHPAGYDCDCSMGNDYATQCAAKSGHGPKWSNACVGIGKNPGHGQNHLCDVLPSAALAAVAAAIAAICAAGAAPEVRCS